MQLYTNNSTGTVTYSSGEFDSSIILENDIEVISSNIYHQAFKLNLGVNERLIFRTYLYFDYHADGDLKYRFLTPTGTVLYRHILRQSEIPIADTITESVSQCVATTGTGEITAAGSTGQHYAWVQYGVLQTPATYAADALKSFNIQFTQNSASATQATVLKAGSYIEYKKF
tara:strand:+ start:762 stop:1277 length:516 start_codon:yes stop_codon:yes gene_type:complete